MVIEYDWPSYGKLVRKGFFEQLTSEEVLEKYEGKSHEKHVLEEWYVNQTKSSFSVSEIKTILLHSENHKKPSEAAVKLF